MQNTDIWDSNFSDPDFQISNREVKASAFTTYFSDPRNAAALYSALGGCEVRPEDIFYTTLSGVLFLARKNDMAFTVKNRVLVISEHQSTINPNMPLRDIIYYGRTMEKLVEPKSLYRSKLIEIPTPEFYVFYNGSQPFPKEKILKLSDSYLENTDNPMLELSTKVININLPESHPVLEKCRPLYEYSWFIQDIKEGITAGLTRDDAIISAIKHCRNEGIMVDFLVQHGSEAINMLYTQFNMDDALEVRYEEGVEDGLAKGLETGRAEGLETGRAEGIDTGIQALISSCKELDISYDVTLEQVKKRFDLDDETAEKNMALYW